MNRLYYHQFTTSKDKMSQNTLLARMFDHCQRLWQGLQGYLTSGKDYKDKGCPFKEKQGTRIRFHPWHSSNWPCLFGMEEGGLKLCQDGFLDDFYEYFPLQRHPFPSVVINFHHHFCKNTIKIIMLITVFVKIFIVKKHCF